MNLTCSADGTVSGIEDYSRIHADFLAFDGWHSRI